MKRKLYEKLLEWKVNKGRMPLIVNGARQTGKTFLISEFGDAEYKEIIYVNLETNGRVAALFDDDITPSRIIRDLELHFTCEIIPGETLIFLDEIQACERALTSLKYFNELTPEHHIICAGSLLGVALNRERYSYPVGNVENLTLYPLDFEEFLWALSKKKMSDIIREHYLENKKISKGIHLELMELYKIYLIVGGMPKVVLEYATSEKFVNIDKLQNEIFDSYIADMAKYATNAESIKIRACYNSIPNQLAKENKKFQYKVVQNGGNANLFGASLEWLEFAGIVKKAYKISQGIMPIAVYTDLTNFKIYMGDVGLLVTKSKILPAMILSNLEIDNMFLGAITENYVAVALSSNGKSLYYWTSDHSAEIDFVIQDGMNAIPVEVKSSMHTKSRSLSVYIEKYNPAYSIRISAKNFGFENNIKSVPLYAVFCI